MRKLLYIVTHNTEGTTIDSTIGWLDKVDPPKKPYKFSYHVLISRDGSLKQCVPFNEGGVHAGKSNWKDITGEKTGKGRLDDHDFSLSFYSVGISLANRSHAYGNDTHSHAASPPVSAEHRNKKGKTEIWEKYTPEQIETYKEVCRALCNEYPSIVNIIGHDDIAVGRKVDPGPMFGNIIPELREELSSNGHLSLATEKKRWAAKVIGKRGESIPLWGNCKGRAKIDELQPGEKLFLLSRVYKSIPLGNGTTTMVLGDYYAVSRDGLKPSGFVAISNVKRSWNLFGPTDRVRPSTV